MAKMLRPNGGAPEDRAEPPPSHRDVLGPSWFDGAIGTHGPGRPARGHFGEIHVYGPGGPLPAMTEAAKVFGEETGTGSSRPERFQRSNSSAPTTQPLRWPLHLPCNTSSRTRWRNSGEAVPVEIKQL
jgi:hypothetical protein